MDTSEFREFTKAATDYIIKYHETIRSRQVSSSVEPGYLFSKLPKEVPNKPEKWQTILEDMENVIMPGMTHWQSPSFHGYFPTAMSYSSIVGELMSAGLGIMGFNWSGNPVCTELEIVMMDWLCRMMNLPSQFLNSSEGPGGGMIQSTASEATLLGLIVAKDKTVRQIKNQFPELDEGSIKSKLVAYTSEHANSSVEKSAIIGSMTMHLLPTDSEGRLHGDTLKEAVENDIEKGLIPCYVIATLGTTGTCAFDLLREIGHVCKLHSLWLHVDAAYAGAAFVCPEYQYLMDGIEYADSLVINLHKWMLVTFDCSAMWTKNRNDVYNALTIDRIYLENCENHYLDLRNFQLPLGRRFRSLKVWFTLRLYGLSGLQEHIRKYVALAKYFERIAREDERFEIVVPAVMGLVCFRLKGKNSLSQLLLDKILKSRQMFIVPATLKDVFVLRFVITSPMTNADDIKKDWNLIQDLASTIIVNENKNVYKSAENGLPKLTGLCKKEILHEKCQKYSQA